MTSAICLALVIFFEGGIESPIGQTAIGWSVINASKSHSSSVCHEVIYSGRYVAINNRLDNEHKISLPTGKKWNQTVHLAFQVIRKKIPDPTNGATNFECTLWKSCKNPPWWAARMTYQGRYGTQDFYKESGHYEHKN